MSTQELSDRNVNPSFRSAAKITRYHSCSACSQRKVKCDGQRPCQTCQKSQAQCISKPVRPARARASKRRQATVVSSEDSALPMHDGDSTSTLANASPGVLIQDKGHSRYVENILWDGLSNELSEPTNTEERPNVQPPANFIPERLIFGASLDVDLAKHHPTPIQAFWLWQRFLDNVNPIVKILHVPSVQQVVLGAISDFETISNSKQALLFSIYLSALSSIPQRDHDECERTMGQPINLLLEKHIGNAQQALINAHFMRSLSVDTLQAFVLFLVSLRARMDNQSLWMMAGLAIRSAQRLGLHREKALDGLPIFDAEIRRRLWWETLLLESHAAKFCGVAPLASSGFSWDTRRPLNINDADLHPDMREPPKECHGTTDMSFCSARYEIGEFTIFNSSPENALRSIESVDREVERLQQRLEDRLLRYCDAAIPAHFLTLLIGRAALGRVKLTVRRRHMFVSKGTGFSLEERNKTLKLCLQLIEIPNDFAMNPTIQNFVWQASTFFPVDALMFVLSELAYRRGEESLPQEVIDRSWTEIGKAYELQPRLSYNNENAIYSAIRNLTLKAWRVTSERNVEATTLPSFIRRLSSIHASTDRALTPKTSMGDSTGMINTAECHSTVDPFDEIDWEYWSKYLAESEELLVDQTDPPLGLSTPLL